MTTTWKDALESKKFWYAVLMLAAFIVGQFGLNLDVAKIIALMAPFGLLLGAQGWADSGPAGAIAAQAKLLRRANALPDGHALKAPMLKMLGVGLLLVFTMSCSAAQRSNGLTCAEGTLSVAQLAEIAADLASDNYDDLISNLAAKEGFALIKCGIETVFATHSPAAEGSGSATVKLTPDPVRAHASTWLGKHGAGK